MTSKLTRAALPAVSVLLLIGTMAEWLLWLMPPPHGRLQYMIAGTASTAAALSAAFALAVMRKSPRSTPRRIVPGSAPLS